MLAMHESQSEIRWLRDGLACSSKQFGVIDLSLKSEIGREVARRLLDVQGDTSDLPQVEVQSPQSPRLHTSINVPIDIDAHAEALAGIGAKRWKRLAQKSYRTRSDDLSPMQRVSERSESDREWPMRQRAVCAESNADSSFSYTGNNHFAAVLPVSLDMDSRTNGITTLPSRRTCASNRPWRIMAIPLPFFGRRVNLN